MMGSVKPRSQHSWQDNAMDMQMSLFAPASLNGCPLARNLWGYPSGPLLPHSPPHAGASTNKRPSAQDTSCLVIRPYHLQLLNILAVVQHHAGEILQAIHNSCPSAPNQEGWQSCASLLSLAGPLLHQVRCFQGLQDILHKICGQPVSLTNPSLGVSINKCPSCLKMKYSRWRLIGRLVQMRT